MRAVRGASLGASASRWGVPAIVAVALILRVAVIAIDGDVRPTADAGDYHRHATSIAAGEGFPPTLIAAQGTPSALRPPAWPYLLGGVYVVAGDSPVAGRIVAAFLGSLAVWLVFLVACRVWDRRVGLVAAALAAVWPSLVLTSNAIMSENLFLPLVLSIVLVVLVIRERRAPPWGLLVLAGVLCGLAALTRVIGLALVLPVAVGVWRGRGEGLGRALAKPAVVALAAVLTVLPWTVRNTLEFDRFVPLATQEGFNLYGTYNPVSEADAEFPAGWRIPLSLPESRDLFNRPGIDEAEISERLGRRGREFLLDHPLYPVRVAYWNTRRMLNLADGGEAEQVDYRQAGIPRRAIDVVEAGVAILVVLALAAAVLLALRGRGRRGPLFMWLVPLLLFAGTVLFLSVPRYRVPLDPFLIMLVAAGAVTAAARRSADTG